MAYEDRYDLIEPLGQGSFGQVFRAFDRSLGHEVALKFLHRQDDDARRRFHREAVVLHSQLANQHVVALVDHEGLGEDDPYIALEFCDLGSLRGWVGAQRDWKDVATALLHAARGLVGLHAVGGLHRDIKPENLLLRRASSQLGWQLKLADFGLAGLPTPDAESMTRTAFGTQGYIAPELFVGATFHQSADVYSLGIVAVELLVGRIDVGALPASGAPVSLVNLVGAMVGALPQKRPTAKVVADKLNAVLVGARAIALPATKPCPSPTPRAIAQPAPVSGWGLAALIAGAAIALGTMNNKDSTGRFHGSDGKFRSGRWG